MVKDGRQPSDIQSGEYQMAISPHHGVKRQSVASSGEEGSQDQLLVTLGLLKVESARER